LIIQRVRENERVMTRTENINGSLENVWEEDDTPTPKVATPKAPAASNAAHDKVVEIKTAPKPAPAPAPATVATAPDSALPWRKVGPESYSLSLSGNDGLHITKDSDQYQITGTIHTQTFNGSRETFAEAIKAADEVVKKHGGTKAAPKAAPAPKAKQARSTKGMWFYMLIPNEFEVDTFQMPAVQIGWFINLVNAFVRWEGQLPKETKSLAQLAGALDDVKAFKIWWFKRGKATLYKRMAQQKMYADDKSKKAAEAAHKKHAANAA
jgi:hypothetical protein